MLTDAEQYNQPIKPASPLAPSISEGARRSHQGEALTMAHDEEHAENRLAGHLSSRVQHVPSNEFKGPEVAAPPDQAINTPLL